MIFIYKLICNIRTLQRIRRGEFWIVKDAVLRLSPEEPVRRHTENAVYFETYGRCVPSSAAFALASVGDVFYLVILDPKKKEISLAFHSSMYECSEMDLASSVPQN